MYNQNINLDAIIVSVDGQVIGNLNSMTATVKLPEIETNEMTEWNKSYEGTLNVEYLDEKFMDYLGLHEYQKALLRQEMRKRQFEDNKSKKKISMREGMNNHFKRGKKW